MQKTSDFFCEISWNQVKPHLYKALKSYADQAVFNVKNGHERAFIINNRSYCLLRAEENELVVVGFVGNIDDVIFINDRAKELGFKTARIHCFRSGMLRKLKSLGLYFYEIEQRKNRDFDEIERVLRMVF